METSLMLHLHADLILDSSKWGSGKAKKHRVQAIASSWAWSERKWSQVTEDTGVGDPSKSTVEKGSQMFTALTKKLADFYAEVGVLDLDDQYTD
jgi:creatinine amidohydrolase